jgi:CheY-like chemotaxis protein
MQLSPDLIGFRWGEYSVARPPAGIMFRVFVMADEAVILLAEDREDDILLVRNAFKKGHLNNPLYVVRDGEELLSYLKGEGSYSKRSEFPLPDLLLLDLKMPRMDGFQVIEWVRAQPSLRSLRIVVLTSSQDMRDVNRAYELGANSFLVKPMEFEHTVETVEMLRKYWLHDSRAPEISRSSTDQREGVANRDHSTDQDSRK